MQIFLLTGCANGVGRHLTGALLRNGHAVAATDVAISQLHQAALADRWPTDRTLLLPLDVRSATDWKHAVQKTLIRWSRIDVGMNVAGVIRPGNVADIRPEDVDFMVDINLKGVMLGTHFLAETMVKQGSGQIINIASLAGVVPVQGLGIYSATKAAIRAFTLAAAAELKKQNIVVSVVCPDLVDTNMLSLQRDYPEATLRFSGRRLLTEQDVVRAVLHDALQRKQIEILLPHGRGWLGKFGNLFKRMSFVMTKLIMKRR